MYYIYGPPASGKSSVIHELSNVFSVNAFDAEQMVGRKDEVFKNYFKNYLVGQADIGGDAMFELEKPPYSVYVDRETSRKSHSFNRHQYIYTEKEYDNFSGNGRFSVPWSYDIRLKAIYILSKIGLLDLTQYGEDV